MQRRPALELVIGCSLVIGPTHRVSITRLNHSSCSQHPFAPSLMAHKTVHLLPPIDQPLLRRRNAFFLLNALLDPRHLVVCLDVELDLLAGEGAHSGRGLLALPAFPYSCRAGLGGVAYLICIVPACVMFARRREVTCGVAGEVSLSARWVYVAPVDSRKRAPREVRWRGGCVGRICVGRQQSGGCLLRWLSGCSYGQWWWGSGCATRRGVCGACASFFQSNTLRTIARINGDRRVRRYHCA